MKPQTLYAIIDPARCAGAGTGDRLEAVVTTTRAVLEGGAKVVQLRDKAGTARQTYHLARRLAGVCEDFDVPFIVNDRVDIALAAGAHGVHVGPEDVPVGAIREVVDDDLIVGGSAGTPDVAEKLEAQGADYLGVGAIYEARESKPDASPPRGPEAIRAVVDAVDLPVVGIGGIDETNAAEVVGAGATGVAVIGALMDADNPREAARRLCDAMA